jgi:hypothetical protein
MSMSVRQKLAVNAMRFVLGAVVLVQSFVFIFSAGEAAAFARQGLPNGLRLALGWSEAAAAVLFLLPPTIVIGAYSLLVVFAGAILIHVLHGQFQVGGLLVYVAAVLVVLADREARGHETGTAAG